MDLKRITTVCVGLFVAASLSINLAAQERPRQVTRACQNVSLKVRATLGHKEQVFDVAFSPNGDLLATGSYGENGTKLWNTKTGELIATLDGIVPVFSHDGQLIRTISNKTVKLWNSAGQLKLTLTGHEGNITAATFSPDDTQLATGSEDGTVKIWNTTTGQTSVTLTVWKVKKIARYRIFSRALHIPVEVYVKFSPDQRQVLTNTYWEHSSAKLWDVSAGRLHAEFAHPVEVMYETKEAGVTKTAFSPDGKFIVTESPGMVKLWQAGSGSLVQEFKIPFPIIGFSPDSRWLGLITGERGVGLFNLKNLTLEPIADVDSDYLKQQAFSPDGRTYVIASGYSKFHATLIDVSTLKVRAKIPLIAKWGFDIVSEYLKDADLLSFHPSSKFLMGVNHSSVRMWDVLTGELVWETQEGRDPAEFSRDGRLLATVAKDKKTVLLWEMVDKARGASDSIKPGAQAPG